MGIRLAIAASALFALLAIFTAHNANVRREAVINERASVEKQAEKKMSKLKPIGVLLLPVMLCACSTSDVSS